MADVADIFLIDGTGFLEASQKSFLGAPLLVVNGEDHTFLFGVMRDLLRLRQKLGINHGVFVIGEEAHQITTDANIEKTVTFLKQFGIAVVHDPHVRALDLCAGLASLVTHVVTQDRGLLQLAKEGRRVVLFDEEAIDVFTCETVISRFSITPDSVPGFLALTSGAEHAVLTRREAIALLQQPGGLAEKIADPSVVSSRKIRNKLKANGDVILRRLKQFSPSGHSPCLHLHREQLKIDIDSDDNGQLLATHAFYSLRRLLRRPAKIPLGPQEANLASPNFQVIETEMGLQSAVAALRASQCCAVDTESSGRDPHSAELYGISISSKHGEAFYIPTLEQDSKGVDRSRTMAVLREVFEGSIEVFGHNLKYDYVLLRRNGINIANIGFDTMLAAYDCFGDADFLNLQYLAKRLLGRTVRAHKDIVGPSGSLLDVPFHDVVHYACEHADATLQLAGVLQQELTRREIDQQYRNETLPLVKTLGDLECDGVPVDVNKLNSIRDALAEQASHVKEAVIGRAGSCFNLESDEEVTAVLKMDPVLAKVICFRKLNAKLLEELAIAHETARLLVRYSRCQKRLRHLEAVLECVQNGRVHPVFSQTRTDHCRLSSVKPKLFDNDNIKDLQLCLPGGLRQFFPDPRKALGILADEAGDNVLRSDLVAAEGCCRLKSIPRLEDGDHFQFLLSIVTGVSDHQLCRNFLLGRSAVAAIRHDFQARYSSTFFWLDRFFKETAANGFASAHGRRRYFDGLRSSNLEKRNSAVHSAVKWLLQW
jgi:DNA polymerase-1